MSVPRLSRPGKAGRHILESGPGPQYRRAVKPRVILLRLNEVVMAPIVSVEDSGVRIEGLVVTNPDVVQYFRPLLESQRIASAIHAVELGVFCLQRAQLGQSMEFVRLEVERLVHAAQTAIAAVPEQLRDKLGGDTGPLKEVCSAVEAAKAAVKEKLDEVDDLFTKRLDPTSTQTTLGQALAKINELLSPNREDSVQKRIEAAVASITRLDGTLASAVRTAAENATAPLKEAVGTLTLALAREAGAQEVLSETPEKGFEFEDELIPTLRNWAALVGAEFEYVGPQNLPGDFTLTLKDTTVSAVPLRMVVEARDREQGWGRGRIIEQMTVALKKWDGNYGIYVSKTQDGLAKEIGEWAELRCEAGPILACVSEHLGTALRFALVEARVRAAATSHKEVDVSSLAAEIKRFEDSLKHLTQIKRNVSEIREILPKIEGEADGMRRTIQDALTKIERALPR